MIKLPKDRYHLLLDSLSSLPINHLFALIVVTGKMEGEVYVDEEEHPRSYLVKHSYGMSLLFGNTRNEVFNKQVVHYILNEDQKRTEPEWLQVYPDEWNDIIKNETGHVILDDDESRKDYHLNQKNIIKDTRVNFRFNIERFKSLNGISHSHLPLARTTGKLFDKINGTVIPQHFWRDGEHFESEGVGYSIVIDDEPVANCFSAYTVEKQMELGIETSESYQGKGFAKTVASAMIRHCLDHDMEPVWACRFSNTKSYHLAQKVGFEPTLYLPYYRLAFSN